MHPKQSVHYRKSFRSLKDWYEKKINKKVADSTFSSFLRQYRRMVNGNTSDKDKENNGVKTRYSLFSDMTTDITNKEIFNDLKVYIDYLEKLGKPLTNLTAQVKCFQVFDEIENMHKKMSFDDFETYLNVKLNFMVSRINRGNWYRWFKIVNQPYPMPWETSKEIYHTNDLKFIGYRCAKWFYAKQYQNSELTNTKELNTND